MLKRKTVHIFIALLLTPFAAVLAQQKTSTYNVLYHGRNIGEVNVSQVAQSGSLALKAVSDIQMRMLIAIKIISKEESVFEKGVLTYSSSFREVNGKQKLNRHIKYENNVYTTVSEGKAGVFNKAPINYNLIRLYADEPLNVTKVYVDNANEFVNVENPSPHIYKLSMTDGNHNTYYYENGILKKIEIHNTLCNIVMQLAGSK